MFRLKYFILGLSIIFANLNILLYAQEETKPYASKEDCIKKFDIDNINLLDHFFQKKIKLDTNLLTNLLLGYFNCRAVLENDIGECNKLGPKGACHNHFNTRHGFLEKLLLSRGSQQPVTREILNACVSEYDLDIKDCKQYMQAFIKGDTSICKNPPFIKDKGDCEAFISLNEALTREQITKDIIFYLKALRDLEVKECKKIQKKDYKRNCEAYVTRDKKICEQDDGFRKFRDIYCTEFSQTR